MPMSDDLLRDAFARCRVLISSFAMLDPERNTGSLPGTPASYKHLIWLATAGPELLETGHREKAMRWLGFIQGALWWGNLASIEELKAMNRQDVPLPPAEPD